MMVKHGLILCLIAHLYDEDTSREIYDRIKEKYISEFEKLEKKLSEI